MRTPWTKPCSAHASGILATDPGLGVHQIVLVKTQKARARELHLQGLSDKQVAQRLKVSDRTVRRWRKADEGTDQDWDLAKVPADQAPSSRRPKLVSFDGHQRSQRRESATVDMGDLGTMAGQLKVIDDLIGIAMREARGPEGPQTYASSMNAVPKLLAERRAISPLDRTALLLLLMDKYRDPAELLEDLKAQGWGRKSA